MTWIVIESDPAPDTYVLILVRQRIEAVELFNLRKQFKVFDKVHEAMAHAVRIKNRYSARSIRIMYPDGHLQHIT